MMTYENNGKQWILDYSWSKYGGKSQGTDVKIANRHTPTSTTLSKIGDFGTNPSRKLLIYSFSYQDDENIGKHDGSDHLNISKHSFFIV